MTVLTGANGSFTFRGQVVARCRAWQLGIDKDALDDTCLGTHDRTYIEGLRGANGSAVILYDPDSPTVPPLLNRILQNNGAPDDIGLVLNSSTNQKLEVSAIITNQSTPMNTGEAVAVSITFQVTGPIGGGY